MLFQKYLQEIKKFENPVHFWMTIKYARDKNGNLCECRGEWAEKKKSHANKI